MKRLILLLMLLLPANLYASGFDLTFTEEEHIKTGEAVIKVNDRVKFFYIEAHDQELGTIDTTKGVTFSFSFDLKKEFK